MIELGLSSTVAICVGLASYSLCWHLALRLQGRRRQRSEEARSQSGLERLGDWLQAIPVPIRLQRAWSTEEARDHLRLAGLPWEPEVLAALRWLALWISITLFLLAFIRLGNGLLAYFLGVVFLLLGRYGPKMWLRLRMERRQREIEHALPDLLDRLRLSMEAGLGFEVALRRAAGDFGTLLGVEIRRMVRLLDLGHRKGQVMVELSRRSPSDDLRAFAAGVRQAEKLGTSLAKTMRVQSQMMRARRRRRAQEASRRLPILVVFPLTFFFLPALLIIYLAPPLLHLFLSQ